MNPRQKAWKKNTIATLIFLGIGVVLAALGFNADSFIGLLGILFIIIAVLWITASRTIIKRRYCAKCGERYDYESDIAWEVAEEYETENDIKDVVNFTCSCSHCGEEVRCSKTFKVAYVDKNGNVHKNNVSALAGKYFKG